MIKKQFPILINFGDNDFQNTFVPLLKLISYGMTKILDKANLLILINELSYGFYMLYQNKFEYEDTPSIRKYLKINEEDLLMNEEAEEFIKNNSDCNHAVFYTYIGSEDKTVYSF